MANSTYSHSISFWNNQILRNQLLRNNGLLASAWGHTVTPDEYERYNKWRLEIYAEQDRKYRHSCRTMSRILVILVIALVIAVNI